MTDKCVFKRSTAMSVRIDIVVADDMFYVFLMLDGCICRYLIFGVFFYCSLCV